jgi:hypothetical protein
MKKTKFKEYKIRIIMDGASLENDRGIERERNDFRFLLLTYNKSE